jgi:anti-anti-sigma factor
VSSPGSSAGTTSRPRGADGRLPIAGIGTTAAVLGLSLSAWTERGYVIAALRGELDIASAPTLREQLLDLLRPGASRLIIDLSAVSYADASGLAVLVGTGRRAGLLGGHLRLAAPSPEVARVLSITGLNQQLDIFPTVHAAITSPPGSPHRHDRKAGERSGPGTPDPAHAQPVAAHTRRPRYAADGGELRLAIAAVLLHADAWRDADPRRKFAPALHDLAQAYTGTSHAWLTQTAHALLSVLTRQPLTHSPAVAATASHLRRILDPQHRPGFS